MKNNALRNLTISAMFTALVLVMTYIHMPMPTGYIHLGDAIIYLAASMLPMMNACLIGAIGGTLADLFSGYAVWAPATLIIKALLALCFTSAHKKILCRRNFIGLIFALIVTVVGYYIAESLIYGNFISPVASILGNILQSVGSSILYIVVSATFDKLNIKNRIIAQ